MAVRDRSCRAAGFDRRDIRRLRCYAKVTMQVVRKQDVVVSKVTLLWCKLCLEMFKRHN